jgi:nuclear pore complex protein Nup93
MLIRHL